MIYFFINVLLYFFVRRPEDDKFRAFINFTLDKNMGICQYPEKVRADTIK